MNILLLNTNNTAGGATKSCYRLHQAYLKKGLSSQLLINDTPPAHLENTSYFYDWYKEQIESRSLGKKIVDKVKGVLRTEDSYARHLQEITYQKQILENRPPGYEVFTFYNSVFDITQHPLYKWADVVHLHWVTNHFFDFKLFRKIRKPIVWTLHDMNPITGGCHYSSGCLKYQSDCAHCPQLQGTINDNYSKKNLQNHVEALSNYTAPRLTIVSPSQWLMEQSLSSLVFRNFPHYLIPYGINESVFRIKNRHKIREQLGIGLDKVVILFAAYYVASKRKGFDYLLSALTNLPEKENIVLLSVGANNDLVQGLGMQLVQVGMVHDEEKMADMYNAADVFVIPSLDDNLPNTVLESLMCGTPVIGFPTGGIPDMVNNGLNGFVTEEISVEALIRSLQQQLQQPLIWPREKIAAEAEKLYKDEVQVNAYLELYRQLVKKESKVQVEE